MGQPPLTFQIDHTAKKKRHWHCTNREQQREACSCDFISIDSNLRSTKRISKATKTSGEKMGHSKSMRSIKTRNRGAKWGPWFEILNKPVLKKARILCLYAMSDNDMWLCDYAILPITSIQVSISPVLPDYVLHIICIDRQRKRDKKIWKWGLPKFHSNKCK